jgi:hypothetical protein
MVLVIQGILIGAAAFFIGLALAHLLNSPVDSGAGLPAREGSPVGCTERTAVP